MTEQPSVIECPPTAELLKHHEGNIVVGGGRMTKGVPQLRYRNHYEIIADRDVDALDADYGQCVSRLDAARYAYLLSQRATAGWRSDTPNEGDADGMPLADFYLAVMNRFTAQRRAVASHAGSAHDHWATLMMLIAPLPEGKSARATRDAMFPFVPAIITALTLLEEYSLAISKTYRDKIEQSKDSVDPACANNQGSVS